MYVIVPHGPATRRLVGSEKTPKDQMGHKNDDP